MLPLGDGPVRSASSVFTMNNAIRLYPDEVAYLFTLCTYAPYVTEWEFYLAMIKLVALPKIVKMADAVTAETSQWVIRLVL